MRKAYLLLIILICLSSLSNAQNDSANQQKMTKEDYQRAVQLLSTNTNPLLYHGKVNPVWLSNGKFWYSTNTKTGQEFVLVNPENSKKVVATSLEGLLATEMSDVTVPALTGRGFQVAVASPDGKKEVYLKNWNLWLRDIGINKETQLTFDGLENFGYATDNAGWRKGDGPIVLWSPDSKKIATFQQDQRHVSDMYLVKTKVGAPELQSWKYPLPVDSVAIMIHRVIIEVDIPKIIRLKIPADPRRGTLCDDISCSGAFDDNEWNKDATKLIFVSSSRDHKVAKLQIANAITGEVTPIMEEKVATQFESGRGIINWHYLEASNEIIWYSERDDWGHLYLYDAKTGKLKNQITKGDFVVTKLLKWNTPNRVLYFEANGREKGRDPYFSHFYSINIDGSGLKLLTPEDGNHQISISPNENYFVDTYSQPNVPPISVLRNMRGKLISALEIADISALKSTGWKAPEPVIVKSHDQVWDLYGLVFTPSNLDKTKKYPVVNYIYPGPSGGAVGSRSFSTSRGDHQALAELGFVVVLIDGSCNPDRSKSFHDACYGNMGENSLQDQVAGIKQLAISRTYMDLERVGVWGHSGGGFASAAAMFRFPEFYKVGFSESGNHDNRGYEDDWSERYIGLLTNDQNGISNYDKQANQNIAANLKGKLMLVHGNMDDNVPPYNTYLVVDALVKANKDFDMIILPHARHSFGVDAPYIMRRRWDYFVKNLLGATPPTEFEIKF